MADEPRSTVFFPGAGSFGSEFRSLTEAFKPACRLARYPGRFGADFGIPAESFDAVVQACTDQVIRQGGPRPVLFGHSFGAYVAYAAALRLQETGTQICALVIAGAGAPDQLTVSEQATGTALGAAAYLNSVDPAALADVPSEEWREVVIDTLIQDLRLLRQFPPGPARVACPVLAVRGEADPLTSDAGVDRWQQFTDGGYSRQVFPGGHSDYLRTAACTSWYREVRDRLD